MHAVLKVNFNITKQILGKLFTQLKRKVVLLRSLGMRNRNKLTLQYYLKACYSFYMWRYRSSQCNELTLNTCHNKFQILEETNAENLPENYFKFLARQEKYLEEDNNVLPTPRYILNSRETMRKFVKLYSLKKISCLVKAKKVLQAWRALPNQRVVSNKLAALYWRKKTLVNHFTYLKNVNAMNKALSASLNAARKYYRARLAKKILLKIADSTKRRKALRINASKKHGIIKC